MPAGEATEVGKMKSSIFMASGSGVSDARSMDSRSCAMPDGALVGCCFALIHRSNQSSALRNMCDMSHHIPCLLPFLALQVHGHHSPCQVLHPLLIGQLGFGFAVELPYLRAQRILLLHVIWIAEIGAGGVVVPVRKECLTQQVLAILLILRRDIQLVSGLAVLRVIMLRRRCLR